MYWHTINVLMNLISLYATVSYVEFIEQCFFKSRILNLFSLKNVIIKRVYFVSYLQVGSQRITLCFVKL